MRLVVVLCSACFLVACAGSSGVSAPTTASTGSARDLCLRNAPEGTTTTTLNERGECLYFTPRGLVDRDGFPVNISR
jgi:hypothetical protein